MKIELLTLSEYFLNNSNMELNSELGTIDQLVYTLY